MGVYARRDASRIYEAINLEVDTMDTKDTKREHIDFIGVSVSIFVSMP
jgi:hypothetical protein